MAAGGEHLLTGLLRGAALAAGLAGVGWFISRKLANVGLVIDEAFGDWPQLPIEAQGAATRETRRGGSCIGQRPEVGEIAPHKLGSTL